MFTKIRLEDHIWETGDGLLISGSVDLQKGRRGASATVTIADPRLALASKIPLPVRHKRPRFEVSFGETPRRMEVVFTGYLSQMSASGLPGQLRLQATGRAHDLRVKERAAIRSDLNALSFIRELARDDGLKVDARRAPELERVRWASVCMYGETGIDLLDRLLPATGHDWHIEQDTIVIEAAGSYDRLVEILYGEDVKNGFEFSVEELRRHTTPNVFSQDDEQLYGELEEDSSESRIVALERTGLTLAAGSAPAMTSQAEEHALAAQSRARKLFHGRLDLTALRPDLKLKDAVMLRGFGPRFSGVWFIESMNHPLDGGRGTTVEIYNGGS